MSVSDRHLNCLVPHKLLDCPQVNPSHDQPTGKGMTQAVPREVFQTRRLHSGRLRRNALHPPYPQLVSPRRTKATEAGALEGSFNWAVTWTEANEEQFSQNPLRSRIKPLSGCRFASTVHDLRARSPELERGHRAYCPVPSRGIVPRQIIARIT